MRDTAALNRLPRPLLPPGVHGLPWVGSLPRLLRERFEFLEAARRQHGDIFMLNLGPIRGIALCHPRHAQHVLVDRVHNYPKGGPFWNSVRTLMGNGLPVSHGEHWRRQRRMLQPAFHHQRLVVLADKVVQTLDESLAEHWEKPARTGEPFNVSRAFTHMTMKVLVRALFGGGLETAEAERASRALLYIIDFMLRGMLTQSLPAWLPIPGQARYREAIRTIDEILLRMIARGEQDSSTEDSLISLLCHSTDAETGERMTASEIRDETMALFVAGYETTTVALAWSLHFLTQQPEFSEQLQAEVDAALGSRTPGFADLPRLPFARTVVQEAIRLYPPAYWLPRTALEDDEIDGYRIPAGTLVGVLSYLIHRRPDFWDEPERFSPERFSPERSSGRHKLAWLAFGAGQRQCVGREFALMEGQLILARVAQRFRVTALPGRVAQVHFGTTLRARDGVWVRLSSR